jgi:glycerol-3-phosphate cytidylyltransferase
MGVRPNGSEGYRGFPTRPCNPNAGNILEQFIRRAAHRARIGYLAGSFDEFNFGHLALLRQARMACDSLVVGVHSDEKLASEGTPAAWPLAARLNAVRRCRFVNDAVPQEDDDVQDIWRRTGFDILFTGGDWRDTYRGMRLEWEVRGLGADVVPLSFAAR